jgi:hypothetical protein
MSRCRFAIVKFAVIGAAALLAAFGARYADAEVIPVAGWDRHLFPSYLVATATLQLPDELAPDVDENTLGDSQGLLGVKVTSPGDGVAVKVTVTGDDILEKSSFSGKLEKKGVTYTILPRIKYKFDRLAKNKQSAPVTVTFHVEVGSAKAEEESVAITLHSINDCPYTISSEDDDDQDISFMFAAYVNEQHPFVDKVLREALDAGVVDSFTGYQSGETAEVYRQVYALWHALAERDVRYSSITVSAAESETVSSQHVRLIDESINNAQANCVDGSVLLASVLRKIGIEPVLVYVPGHCYLGFYLDDENKKLELLETTLIGSAPDDETPKIAALKDVADKAWREKDSWKTFVGAIAMGREDYKKNLPKFKSEEDADYQLVNIAAARKMGILPIAFDGSSKFEAVE